MFDLHLHSAYSDGTVSVAELVNKVSHTGLSGFSLTDHDGLWGLAEAAELAQKNNIEFLEGIEISSQHNQTRLHILGYAKKFKHSVLNSGLVETAQAHRQRIINIVKKCQAEGYTDISFEVIEESRATHDDPVFVTYDVEKELMNAHKLSADEAHKLLVPGGSCYIDYNIDRALSSKEAINLIHRAGGVAVLAHAGIIAHEESEQRMLEVINYLTGSLDGLEVHHPFHLPELEKKLLAMALKNNLLVTGGSDWHGEGRYDDTAMGEKGIDKMQWQQLTQQLT